MISETFDQSSSQELQQALQLVLRCKLFLFQSQRQLVHTSQLVPKSPKRGPPTRPQSNAFHLLASPVNWSPQSIAPPQTNCLAIDSLPAIVHDQVDRWPTFEVMSSHSIPGQAGTRMTAEDIIVVHLGPSRLIQGGKLSGLGMWRGACPLHFVQTPSPPLIQTALLPSAGGRLGKHPNTEQGPP